MKERRNRGKSHWLRNLLLLLVIGTVFYYSQYWWIVPQEVTFTSTDLPAAFDGLRIVQVSDLHGKEFGRDSASLLRAVADQEPDLIAITGDLVDLKTDWSILPPLLEGLSDIAPSYFVTGNHEWTLRQNLPAALDMIRSCGVTVLENQFLILERDGAEIALCGIHDPNGRADQKTPQELFSEVPEGLFTLLLAHRNEHRQDYLEYDLTLVGHAHGGIVRLPFTDGLVDTQMDWFPSYTNGFYELESGATMFVSRGLGETPRFGLRLFNRPHLPVIVLRTF